MSGEPQNSWDNFQRLAAVARREPAPQVEVRAAVLRALHRRAEQPAPAIDPLALVCAAVSVAVAGLALVLLLPGWDSAGVGDTLVTCLNPLTLVLQ